MTRLPVRWVIENRAGGRAFGPAPADQRHQGLLHRQKFRDLGFDRRDFGQRAPLDLSARRWRIELQLKEFRNLLKTETESLRVLYESNPAHGVG